MTSERTIRALVDPVFRSTLGTAELAELPGSPAGPAPVREPYRRLSAHDVPMAGITAQGASITTQGECCTNTIDRCTCDATVCSGSRCCY